MGRVKPVNAVMRAEKTSQTMRRITLLPAVSSVRGRHGKETGMSGNWWENTPWRMVQTNLREIDMENINAEAFADELADFNATVVNLNAAGILASYDTKLDFQNRSAFLHGDSLKEIVDACHRRGIRVIARCDFSKIGYNIYEQHPDWVYRDADGRIMNYNGFVQTCVNGAYQQQYMFEILRELFTTHDFDGLYCNMAGTFVTDYDYNVYGPCHCDNCTRLFAEQVGGEFPRANDPRDPAFRRYMGWIGKCAAMQKRKMYAEVKKINPAIAVNGFDYSRTEANQDIGRPTWIYQTSANARRVRGAGTKPYVSDTASVDFLGFRYRHSSVSSGIMEVRQWQSLAYTQSLSLYIMGTLGGHKDRTALRASRKAFDFMAAHEELYRGAVSGARVLLIDKPLMGREDKEVSGLIRALTEVHIPFDEGAMADLTPEILSRYEAVVLPDVLSLSDAQAGVLDEYVRGGGKLIASGKTACFNERRMPRGEVAVKAFGLGKVAEVRTGLKSSVFEVTGKDENVFISSAEAGLGYVVPGSEILVAEPAEGTEKYLKLVPEQKVGPPEVCYATGETDIPGVFRSHYGKGTAVFVPFLAGTFYQEQGYENTFLFLKDVFTRLAGITPIAVDLTPMCEITVTRQPGRTLIHLINTTGCFGNSFFEPVPLRHIKLHLDLPAVCRITAHNGGNVELACDGCKVVLALDKLNTYEVITVEDAFSPEK